MAYKYYAFTPAGSICLNTEADTEQGAIERLLEDASHMPYDGWDSPTGFGFKQRGYTIMRLDLDRMVDI